MKKLVLLLLLCCPLCIFAQESRKDYTILLTGASFAAPNNGWFELGCRYLNADPVNRAVNGQSIAVTANNMANGTLYSAEELDEIDAFVIMQVHDRDVADETNLKAKYTDYVVPFPYATYAEAYDYVIKRYITECYNLKFNDKSKYYNTPYGKPVIIVFCTHWHDVRTVFNQAIRKLAAKWGFPVVEFDKNVGFSMNTLHPVTGGQYSLLYARDKEVINGIDYGWHPQEGQDKYIQQRMAAIFADVMKKILPLK
jgi:hypothetical protein